MCGYSSEIYIRKSAQVDMDDDKNKVEILNIF